MGYQAERGSRWGLSLIDVQTKFTTYVVLKKKKKKTIYSYVVKDTSLVVKMLSRNPIEAAAYTYIHIPAVCFYRLEPPLNHTISSLLNP